LAGILFSLTLRLYKSVFTENSVATQKHSSASINTNKIQYKIQRSVQRSSLFLFHSMITKNKGLIFVQFGEQVNYGSNKSLLNFGSDKNVQIVASRQFVQILQVSVNLVDR